MSFLNRPVAILLHLILLVAAPQPPSLSCTCAIPLKQQAHLGLLYREAVIIVFKSVTQQGAGANPISLYKEAHPAITDLQLGMKKPKVSSESH